MATFYPILTSTPKRKSSTELDVLLLAPKKKKSRVSRVAGAQKTFQTRIKSLKDLDPSHFDVELSLHKSKMFPNKNNFLMLRQKSNDVNAILIHESLIPRLISKLEHLYEKSCESNHAAETKVLEEKCAAETTVNYNENNIAVKVVEEKETSNCESTKHTEEKPGNSKDNPVIIDEWDINASQSTYRKTLAEVYAQLMVSQISIIAERNCEGCQKKYSSQRDHECIMSSNEELVNLYFWELFESVGDVEANALCTRRMGDFTRVSDLKITFTKEELRNYVEWINVLEYMLKEWLQFKQQLQIE